MKLKTNILFSLLLCGTFATAQNLKLDILPPSVTLGQDSAIVSMKMTLNVPQMDTKSHIRLTPVLTDGTHTAELPQILLNGERAHRLYQPHPGAQQTKRQSKYNSRIYRYPL